MKEIAGVGDVSPDKKKIYQKEFLEGAKLFQQALEKHHQSKEAPQKAAFEKVMKEALQVMNQTVKQGFGKEKIEEEKKLEQNYQNYLSHQDKSHYEQLIEDIGSLKE